MKTKALHNKIKNFTPTTHVPEYTPFDIMTELHLSSLLDQNGKIPKECAGNLAPSLIGVSRDLHLKDIFQILTGKAYHEEFFGGTPPRFTHHWCE